MDCEDAKLVLEGLKKGEDWAFNCLYEKCYDLFRRRAINKFAKNASDIEDIYSNALENLIVFLWKNPDWKPKTDIFAYFFIILRNTGIAYSKNRTRNQTTDLSIVSPYLRDKMPEDYDYSKVDASYHECLEAIRKRNPRAAKAIELNNSKKFPYRNESLAVPEDELVSMLEFNDKDALKVLRARWWRRLKTCVKNKLA